MATPGTAARKVLMFAAVVEMATGMALLATPRLVIAWLISGDEPPQAMPLGRVAGVAVLALGVACWPRDSASIVMRAPPVAAMLLYNALIALYLAYLFLVLDLGGVLLWPAVAFHGVMAVLLARLASGNVNAGR